MDPDTPMRPLVSDEHFAGYSVLLVTSPTPQSALIIEVPEAEPAVARHRQRLDASAQLGTRTGLRAGLQRSHRGRALASWLGSW